MQDANLVKVELSVSQVQREIPQRSLIGDTKINGWSVIGVAGR